MQKKSEECIAATTTTVIASLTSIFGIIVPCIFGSNHNILNEILKEVQNFTFYFASLF